jgi:hypothetical protein
MVDFVVVWSTTRMPLRRVLMKMGGKSDDCSVYKLEIYISRLIARRVF